VTWTAHRLGSPLENRFLIGDRVPLSGNQPVHGYRSQHIQFDGWKRKQQPADGAIDQLFQLLAIEPDDQSEACFF
jgi:hypothetical protein